MAVSLSDAWNDPPIEAPPSVVSAKRSTSIDVDDEPLEEKAETHELREQGFVELLEEFRLLRVEEARRCTVYLAIGGILFAILFLYIERLQKQIRILNGIIGHGYIPGMSHPHTRLPVPIRTTAQSWQQW